MKRGVKLHILEFQSIASKCTHTNSETCSMTGTPRKHSTEPVGTLPVTPLNTDTDHSPCTPQLQGNSTDPHLV